jgi:hypothetical protein
MLTSNGLLMTTHNNMANYEVQCLHISSCMIHSIVSRSNAFHFAKRICYREKLDHTFWSLMWLYTLCYNVCRDYRHSLFFKLISQIQTSASTCFLFILSGFEKRWYLCIVYYFNLLLDPIISLTSWTLLLYYM